METQNQLSCTERIDSHLESRLEDLRSLWEAQSEGIENATRYKFKCPACYETVFALAEYDTDGLECSDCDTFLDIDRKADTVTSEHIDGPTYNLVAPLMETEDIGNLNEYGLCFDYVEPDTFEDQPYGYWRYQLSYGGPSDEFRLHGGGRIEYRFHDWFDGAGRDLFGDDLKLLRDIFDWFLECSEERHGF